VLKATVTPLKLLATTLGGSLLFGCTPLTQLPKGTAYSDVQAQYGQPQAECQLEQETLAVWSQQPMGYYAWRGRFDANQQLVDMQQVLTDSSFGSLEQEQWDKEAVWCHFGPPGEQRPAPYLGTMLDTWTYRYKQNNVWPMMMNIFFNDRGQVQAIQRSMDPRENDGKFFFGW